MHFRNKFKTTKDTKGKMAFIITNNDNGNLFDINDSRKSRDLEKYFKRYSKQERDKVKQISIDIFHIVIQAYNALNSTRVSLCKKDNPNYNKLKDYWKLIVKNEKDFNKFKEITLNQNKNLSPKMKQALKLYKENIKYIENSFKYGINNKIIEGTNNLIKCIKRIAFV